MVGILLASATLTSNSLRSFKGKIKEDNKTLRSEIKKDNDSLRDRVEEINKNLTNIINTQNLRIDTLNSNILQIMSKVSSVQEDRQIKISNSNIDAKFSAMEKDIKMLKSKIS